MENASDNSTIEVADLVGALEEFLRNGNRLEMIMPADSPRIAVVSGKGGTIRLISNNSVASNAATDIQRRGWVKGRAGMAYLDLIPDRFAGDVVASRIRLSQGGPVADSVHFHRIDLQIIFCLNGRVRVVYEDQGPPFWLEPGDCVLQPREIRHRVLEAEAGSEVLELACPAEHETWIDHELDLPNQNLDTERDFGGQRFVRHIASTAEWSEFYEKRVSHRDTGISEATDGFAAVNILKIPADAREVVGLSSGRDGFEFLYVLSGRLEISENGQAVTATDAGGGVVVPRGTNIVRNFHPGTEAVCIQIPKFRSIEDSIEAAVN